MSLRVTTQGLAAGAGATAVVAGGAVATARATVAPELLPDLPAFAPAAVAVGGAAALALLGVLVLRRGRGVVRDTAGRVLPTTAKPVQTVVAAPSGAGVRPNPAHSGAGVGWTMPENFSLFGRSGVPSPDDFVLGRLGNCYLFVALRRLARTDPQQIAQRIWENPDGAISVKFGDDVVTVTREVPVDAQGQLAYGRRGVDGSLAGVYIEKAHAARYANGYRDTGDGGYAHAAFDELLGTRSQLIREPAGSSVEHVRALVARGESVVVGTRTPRAGTHPLEVLDRRLNHITAPHGYEVIDVRPNRWGRLEARLGDVDGRGTPRPLGERAFRRMVDSVSFPGEVYTVSVGPQGPPLLPALIVGGTVTGIAVLGAATAGIGAAVVAKMSQPRDDSSPPARRGDAPEDAFFLSRAPARAHE